MDLNHEFIVNVPIAKAWTILTNLELIAPCLPGAELTEVRGDNYYGIVKVKVGPIVAKFEGRAEFLERNEVERRAVLKGEGLDKSGKGKTSAIITAQLETVSDTSSRCKVHTDLAISGKLEEFVRGALEHVSDKLLAKFVDNLNQLIAKS